MQPSVAVYWGNYVARVPRVEASSVYNWGAILHTSITLAPLAPLFDNASPFVQPSACLQGLLPQLLEDLVDGRGREGEVIQPQQFALNAT